MAIVYVSPTGSDAYSYAQAQSSSTPWATVGKCQTSATAGDTIILLNGIHTWETVAFTKNFIFLAQTYGSVFMEGNNAAINWSHAFANPSPTFTDIIFQNAKTVVGANGDGIFSTRASATSCTFTFTNCKLLNMGVGSYADFSNAVLGGATGHAGNIITYNLIRTLITTYLITTGSPSFYPILSERNANGVVVNLLRSILSGVTGITGIFSGAGDYNTNANTLFTVKNSIMYNPGTSFAWSNKTPYAKVCTYSGHYNVIALASGAGNLTSDPLFVDPAGGNYNLQPGSPYIGIGNNP